MIINRHHGGKSYTDATALANDILINKTAYSATGKTVGTMLNNGAMTGTISTRDGTISIAEGYHNGSGSVSISAAERAKIVPGSIRQGITILGVTGTFEALDVTGSITYTYTGASMYFQESATNWRLELMTSGILNISVADMSNIDIYLLGGGQHGMVGSNYSIGSNDMYTGGPGGQGGYICIASNVPFMVGQDYSVTIGAGAASGNGTVGGTSTAFGYSAVGGGTVNPGSNQQGGASGGTEGAYAGDSTPYAGGPGADSTVYDFGGINRGGGGAGGVSCRYNNLEGKWYYNPSGNLGGELGGASDGIEAVTNYGGGGVGRNRSSSLTSYGSAGSSGIVIIRNAR